LTVWRQTDQVYIYDTGMGPQILVLSKSDLVIAVFIAVFLNTEHISILTMG